MTTAALHAFLPAWAEWLAAILIVSASFVSFIGALGLVRLKTFFQRVHGPALCATYGVWGLSLANALYFSLQGGQVFVHALLIAIFTSVTAPVSTIFLMRVGLFRGRQAGRTEIPAALSDAAHADATGPTPTR